MSCLGFIRSLPALSASGIDAVIARAVAQSGAPAPRSHFASGFCAEFAVALHYLTGWPLGAYFEVAGQGEERVELVVHAVVESMDAPGDLVDAYGPRRRASVAKGCFHARGTRLVYRRVSAEDLDAVSGCGLDGDMIEQAFARIARDPVLARLTRLRTRARVASLPENTAAARRRTPRK